jgi:hypothetical protein
LHKVLGPEGPLGPDNKFEAAVILGTVAGKKLPPASRDMRVVSTMLLLRKAFNDLYPNKYLHVVGENCIDSTAALALVPVGKHLPDFVNTQAIYARALTMGLAYPFAQPAIAQLFYQDTTSPYLKLAEAGNSVIPFGRATFAQVTQAVARKFPGAVCIGYLTKEGDRHFAPHPNHAHDYKDGDFLLIFARGEFAPSRKPSFS